MSKKRHMGWLPAIALLSGTLGVMGDRANAQAGSAAAAQMVGVIQDWTQLPDEGATVDFHRELTRLAP